MKYILVFITILFVNCKNNKNIILNQEENDNIINTNICITNDMNNHLLNIPKLNYTNGKANYVYEGFYNGVYKEAMLTKEYEDIYNVTNIKKEDLSTGFIFYIEDVPNVYYGFPLHYKVFNFDYFEKIINTKKKFKIYVSVYKRDSISDLKTIIIDSVKLR